MALKVKAVEKLVKFSKTDAGVWRWVMQPELYLALAQEKVIKEAALRSGVSRGVMQACWDAAGDQGMGNGRSLGGSARTGYHALRIARQVGRGRERREVEPYQYPSHHLHARSGPEGRAEEHRRADYLHRP